MDSANVLLHGGPLDGTVRPTPMGPDGRPPERADFDHEYEGGLWYVEYRRIRHGEDGWHFQATGNQERADED